MIRIDLVVGMMRDFVFIVFTLGFGFLIGSKLVVDSVVVVVDSVVVVVVVVVFGDCLLLAAFGTLVPCDFAVAATGFVTL